MEDNQRVIRIIEKDGFQAVYFDEDFYKDLVICDLEDLMFILDKVETKEEVMMVVQEFLTRLELTPDKNDKIKSTIWELENFLKNDKLKQQVSGHQAAKHIASKLSDEKLKDALEEPAAYAIGDVGVEKQMFQNANPLAGHIVFEEAEIQAIIKENKVKKIDEEVFGKETDEEVSEKQTLDKPKQMSLIHKLQRIFKKN